MSTIAKYREMYGVSHQLSCSFCGSTIQHDEGGFLSARVGDLFCCPKCAIHTLPRFLADSIRVDPSDSTSVRRLWRNAENHYLSGITTRLLTVLRELKSQEG